MERKCEDQRGTCIQNYAKCKGNVAYRLVCPGKKKCCITKVGPRSLGRPRILNGDDRDGKKGEPMKPIKRECEDQRGTCIQNPEKCEGKVVSQLLCPGKKQCCIIKVGPQSLGRSRILNGDDRDGKKGEPMKN